MSLFVAVLWAVVLALVALEIVLYVVRAYDLAVGEEHRGLRRGIVNVALSFLADAGALLLRVVGIALSWFWPFPNGGSRPVLFVHGYGGSRSDFLWLAWRLRGAGLGPLVGFNYRSIGASFTEAKTRVGDALAAISERGAVDVVAHGAGGLLVRSLSGTGHEGRVRRLVTLGTPHSGTRLAVFAFDSFGASLHPGSAVIAELAEGRSDAAVTAIFSPFDATVLPPRAAALPSAATVEIEGIGHNALLFSPRVARILMEVLS